MSAHSEDCLCSRCEALREAVVGYLLGGPPKPTIPLRIRVAVKADGVYLAAGTNDPSDPTSNGEEMTSAMSDALGGKVVAWHWVTADVPMPETEHGEVKGTVEP